MNPWLPRVVAALTACCALLIGAAVVNMVRDPGWFVAATIAANLFVLAVLVRTWVHLREQQRQLELRHNHQGGNRAH